MLRSQRVNSQPDYSRWNCAQSAEFPVIGRSIGGSAVVNGVIPNECRIITQNLNVSPPAPPGTLMNSHQSPKTPMNHMVIAQAGQYPLILASGDILRGESTGSW